ncbi:hypothetical protein HWV62_21496 [Athelia sp. TMB]|nr:hypothetical protein HWV62_21496 [Athelia sp. TMB]
MQTTILAIPQIAVKKTSPAASAVSSNSSDSSDSSPPTVALIIGTVEQDAPSKVPIWDEGDITPEQAKKFEDMCIGYFKTKEIDDDKCVQKVLAGFRDPHMQGLTFKVFMKEFCDTFLEKDWEGKLRRKLLTMKQSGTPFRDFLCNVQVKNMLLEDTGLHLDKTKLCHQVEAGLEDVPDCQSKLLKVTDIKGWKDWTQELGRIDDLISTERGEMQHMFNLMCDSSCHGNTDPLEPSCCASSGGTGASSAHVDFTPRLTEKERELLCAFEGCFRCQRFFVDHQLKNCKANFPTAAGYKKRMMADVEAVHAQKGHRRQDQGTGKPIAVVVGSSSRRSVSPKEHCRSASPRGRDMPTCCLFLLGVRHDHRGSGHHAESRSSSVSGGEYHPVAVVMDSASNPAAYVSANKGDVLSGSEGDSVSMGDTEVHVLSLSVVAVVIREVDNTGEELEAPLRRHHLFWSAICVHDADAKPLNVCCLLDNGSHLVLISPDIANWLGLPCHALKSPEVIQCAMQSDYQPNIVLTEYVNLKLLDPLFCWTACTIQAMVTSHLTVPVIL